MNCKLIGIAGVARSGKDTMGLALKRALEEQGETVKIYALADALKADVRDFVLSKMNIDVCSCEGESKEIIRPILVGFGVAMRKLTKGKHWVSIVEQLIERDKPTVAIITDIRFAEHEEDELQWIKNNGGCLIHVSRYEGTSEVLPANEDERANDPLLCQAADVQIHWRTYNDKDHPEIHALAQVIVKDLFNEV
jgi:hypothetical protein